MKRSNPLFVDSTRTQGEDIATQIELNHIAPYLGEEIYVKVTDKAGAEQVSVLERRNDHQAVGFVLLKHQQEITFQFFVARSGKPVFMSNPRSTRATYLIADNWEPVPVDESLCAFLKGDDISRDFFGPPMEEDKDETPVSELVAQPEATIPPEPQNEPAAMIEEAAPPAMAVETLSEPNQVGNEAVPEPVAEFCEIPVRTLPALESAAPQTEVQNIQEKKTAEPAEVILKLGASASPLLLEKISEFAASLPEFTPAQPPEIKPEEIPVTEVSLPEALGGFSEPLPEDLSKHTDFSPDPII